MRGHGNEGPGLKLSLNMSVSLLPVAGCEDVLIYGNHLQRFIYLQEVCIRK